LADQRRDNYRLIEEIRAHPHEDVPDEMARFSLKVLQWDPSPPGNP
jgi:hypothetical protein